MDYWMGLGFGLLTRRVGFALITLCFGNMSLLKQYACTDDEPLLHAFNYQTSCLYPPECSLSRTPDMTSRFCTGHQQQITCMSFSHDSKLLATGSWDSLCILWRVPNRPNTSDPSQLVRLSPLAVVQKLPVDDCGVLCLSFTPDDAMLVTCGECKIKVWNLDEIESTISTSPSVTQRTNNLSNELLEYESAIPSSFSVEYSLRVAEFDESLSLLISNFDWAAPNVAIQDPLVMQESLGSQQTDPISLIPDDAISSCINRCLGLATDTVEKFMSQDGDHHNQPHKNAMPWLAGDDFFLEDDPLMSLYTQTQLRTSFMAMDKFSFQELLNPAANSPNTCTLKAPSAILSVNTAQSRMFQDVTHVRFETSYANPLYVVRLTTMHMAAGRQICSAHSNDYRLQRRERH